MVTSRRKEVVILFVLWRFFNAIVPRTSLEVLKRNLQEFWSEQGIFHAKSTRWTAVSSGVTFWPTNNKIFNTKRFDPKCHKSWGLKRSVTFQLNRFEFKISSAERLFKQIEFRCGRVSSGSRGIVDFEKSALNRDLVAKPGGRTTPPSAAAFQLQTGVKFSFPILGEYFWV